MIRENPNRYISNIGESNKKHRIRIPVKYQQPGYLGRYIAVTSVLIAVTLISIVAYFYPRRGGEVGRITREISSIIELPAETPRVATITDRTKLSQQLFFEQAQNGDKLLVYTKSQKVILYRPSIHKVVDVAPVVSTATTETDTDK